MDTRVTPYPNDQREKNKLKQNTKSKRSLKHFLDMGIMQCNAKERREETAPSVFTLFPFFAAAAAPQYLNTRITEQFVLPST